MKKLFILLFILTSCVGEKFTSTEVQWEIQSIRVDDDHEYHFTAITENGYVRSVSDLDYEIDYLYHTNVPKPIVKVSKKCGEFSGCWYENKNYKILLPMGYRIETFED